MNNLQSANVAECLTMVNEFYDAVAVADSDQELSLKKERAGQALDHLGIMLNVKEEDPDLDVCSCVNHKESCDPPTCVTGAVSKHWSTRKNQDSNA